METRNLLLGFSKESQSLITEQYARSQAVLSHFPQSPYA